MSLSRGAVDTSTKRRRYSMKFRKGEMAEGDEETSKYTILDTIRIRDFFFDYIELF